MFRTTNTGNDETQPWRSNRSEGKTSAMTQVGSGVCSGVIPKLLTNNDDSDENRQRSYLLAPGGVPMVRADSACPLSALCTTSGKRTNTVCLSMWATQARLTTQEQIVRIHRPNKPFGEIRKQEQQQWDTFWGVVKPSKRRRRAPRENTNDVITQTIQEGASLPAVVQDLGPPRGFLSLCLFLSLLVNPRHGGISFPWRKRRSPGALPLPRRRCCSRSSGCTSGDPFRGTCGKIWGRDALETLDTLGEMLP